MAVYQQTYSELVDEIVTLSMRGDKIADIKGYVNQAVRDCQVLANFFRDMVEDSLTTSGSDPYLWDPLPTNFRLMRTVGYPSLGIYPGNKPPGRIQADQEEYYYVSPTYATFKGCIQETEVLVSYYEYRPRLAYFADGLRPAIYDVETSTWSYLSGSTYVSTLGSATLDTAARDSVTNWLIFLWYELIKEGALAKLYYTLDDPRGPKNLGLFKSSQQSLLRGETFESMNV